jgi:hemoglobin/transferrin/lactoferrin receptor protein
MGSVIDDALRTCCVLRDAAGGGTRLPWLPDASGNYTRATNPASTASGGIPGVLYAAATGLQLSATLRVATGGWRNDRRRDHAWLPFLGHGRTCPGRPRLPALQRVRFPSMFESTIAFSSSLNPLYALKPEHAYNYELGYVHNLSGLFGNTADADVKLAYYVHKTRNVIERDGYFLFDNIDKQTIRGLELQARFDNRRFFTDLGITRTLENEVCDESTAVLLDANRAWCRTACRMASSVATC